jgi:hypothetical protein
MKTLSIIKYVFLTIGAIMLAGTFYLYQNQQDFLKKANTVQGTVIELVANRSDNSTTYTPVVAFKTKKGEEITYTSSVSSNPPSYSEGETVEILYDPADPKDASINGFASLWIGCLILGILGTIFFLIGFLMILFAKLKEKKKEYLKDNGKRILTKFDHVQLSNFKVNGRSPFLIYSQWLNTNTNELHLFKSEDIWFDPTDYIGTEPIKVMIDPANPKKYYMDISFLPKVNS